MKKAIRRLVRTFKCSECETGYARLIATSRGNNVTIDVKDCDACKKRYGIKTIAELREVITH